MNVEQIIKMIDAGYTKEEIEKMTQPEPKQEPKQEQKQEPVNDPVLKELQDLKKAVYAMNIMQSSQPSKAESVDDILTKALKEG